MLFNSHIFIFIFLPLSLVFFFLLGKIQHKLAIFWLTAASLFFYGWWNIHYLTLLLSSIIFNFILGAAIASQQHRPALRKGLFIIAVSCNLLLLIYYKYTGFFLKNINSLLTTPLSLPDIILPLGISFFTFTQIAFLVDAYRGEVKEYNFLDYALFVTYFPHLIAGPIMHHKEMMPQFRNPATSQPKLEYITVGITIFIIGLFKKVILADGIQPLVTPVFINQAHPEFWQAWSGAIAYTFQLYFDFSGYCDMAIGISLLFGIKLPLNFYSPYQASNIIDFWRRWHITLSRFLRDYLYIPLGGNRKGSIRRYTNLLITMLLGGLWHGANWTFVVWGGLHGIYLMINHGWQTLTIAKQLSTSALFRVLSRVLTLLAVIVAWVFFRAPNMTTALDIIRSMLTPHGFDLHLHKADLLAFQSPILRLLISSVIIWGLPNTQQLLRNMQPSLATNHNNSGKATYWLWQPSISMAICVGMMSMLSILLINKYSEFLYFQF